MNTLWLVSYSIAHLSATHILKPHSYFCLHPKVQNKQVLSPPKTLSANLQTYQHVFGNNLYIPAWPWTLLPPQTLLFMSMSLENQGIICVEANSKIPQEPQIALGIPKYKKNRHLGNKGIIPDSLHYYWTIGQMLDLVFKFKILVNLQTICLSFSLRFCLDKKRTRSCFRFW